MYDEDRLADLQDLGAGGRVGDRRGGRLLEAGPQRPRDAGSRARFEELRVLLDGSGLEVRRSDK